ncbi:DEAD/DEAH box helicase [Luteolibacter algae]|uniref:DEAD/DEAH box helicase n=1 Tax=Luteolibacter algae TaxID=454151 RepID=A0ABW5D443_9BACT
MEIVAALEEFLAEGAWVERFDDEVRGLGTRLVSKVKNLRLDGDEEIEASARVLEAETEAFFWPEGGGFGLESSCTCDAGAFCEHGFALVGRMAKERKLGKFFGRSAGEAVSLALQDRVPVVSDKENAPEPEFELVVKKGEVDRATKLLLKSLGEKELDQWIYAEAFVNYGKLRSPLAGAGEGGKTPAEMRAIRELRDTGLSSMKSNPAWRFMLSMKSRSVNVEEGNDKWFPDPGRVTVDAFWHQFRGEMVDVLESSGWKISFEKGVGHEVHDADPGRWETRLLSADGERDAYEGNFSDGGWFSLSVGFDVDGERYDLMPILAGLLKQDFLEETLDRPNSGYVYAPLPNGDALKLPIGRVRRLLHHLSALVDPKFFGKVQIHALDAAALDGLEGLGIETPKGLEVLKKRLENFSKIEEIETPLEIKATLRDYQLAGFQWMQFLARHGLHGILADDMGLGKTLQTITHLMAEKTSGRNGGKPSLVIAPTSVVPNWRAEVVKFAPGLRVLVLNGADRKRYFRSIPHADLVITSFALLQRDIEKLLGFQYHIMVLDEAQYIKNPRAKVAQAACRVIAKHRLCLSGTPIENHLGELWSLMHFLIPGYLGTEDIFNTRFRKPIEDEGDAEKNDLLKKRIAPLVLRRTKDQVAKELPPKTEMVHLIELHSDQKDLYETVRATMDKRVREAIAARGIEQSQIVFLDALLKLRQICCDPRLLPPDFADGVKNSAKLKFLINLLATLIEEDRRILIFSQFTTMLSLIEEHLLKKNIAYLKLTGGSKDRGKMVEQFQSEKFPVFLISLKAGGTGLNLTAADTVIHYDPWWNPAAEAQATDRAYRIGQDKPVFVHKLLCQETVEERIHRLQLEKARLADGLLADSDIVRKLDAAMMRELLA